LIASGGGRVLFRRHFFLVIAILALGLMAVAGAARFAFAPKSGPSAAGAPGGSGGGHNGGGKPVSPVSVAVVGTHNFVDAIEVLGVAKGR
jgi:membrane fusion protein (multidrug efflux system)